MLNLSELKTFRRGCLKFLVFTLNKLFEKSAISNVLVKNASCLKPENLLSESDFNQLMMKSLLRYLVNCKVLDEPQSDNALRQFNLFRRDDCKKNSDKVTLFTKSEGRLDDLYFNQLHVSKYKEFASVLKILFALSQGQSSVEIGFSLNKTILGDNLEQKSIMSQRLIKDHMIMENVKPHTIEISIQLI